VAGGERGAGPAVDVHPQTIGVVEACRSPWAAEGDEGDALLLQRTSRIWCRSRRNVPWGRSASPPTPVSKGGMGILGGC
jgi:hypothetical protein